MWKIRNIYTDRDMRKQRKCGRKKTRKIKRVKKRESEQDRNRGEQLESEK